MRHRCFSTECNKPLDGLDYRASRPFASWRSSHLETLIGGWLQLDPPCLELATLALAELSNRGEDLNARMKFARVDLEPISWLDRARSHVLINLAPDAGAAVGRGQVYVILRGGYTAENGWYGAYVGSTVKSVDRRYNEHRVGKRSARGLPEHGIEPLYSLFLPINPVSARKEKLREWETRLNDCLSQVVPKVTGDVAF